MDGLDFDSAPAEFQKVRWIVETPLIIAGVGWTLNYFFTIRKAYQDRMSGVSLIALSNNLAWEVAFALINPPPNPFARVNYPLWLSINAFVLYATVKFERESGSHSPFMRRHLPFIILVSILGMLSGHLAFSSHVGPLAALFWGGMLCQVTLSASALGLLLQRGHTRGMSYRMW
jgi:paspaline synthase